MAPPGLALAMQTTASIRGVLGLLVLGALIAIPAASAFPVGVDAASVGDLTNAGGHATYGQTWVGAWMKSNGWGAYESDLRSLAGAGVTPVVLWYYWGDAITVSCVQYGCNGLSKGEWDGMAATMAQKANAAMGGKPFLVVLEPEFNKGGIATWDTFDGYLANQASIIRQNAPNAKIVLGFGSWGGYAGFDRAATASDYVGFQFMRASTRNAASEAQGPADTFVSTAQTLKGLFGKPVLVFDFAIASYGGWEWVQQAAFQNLQARSADLSAAGIVGVVWRYVHDNSYSSGYFGPAESTWGLKYASGGAKLGWDDLVSFSRGGAPSATFATSSTSSSSTFSNVRGNAWWIESDVAGSPSSVSARVNGGPWIGLAPTSWGSWAVSANAPTGATVDLRADYGGSSVSASYLWPAATPVSTFSASFSNVKGNAWWVQADVSANAPIAGVSASVNGGAWTPLAKQSWGSWAASIPAPAGSSVQLEAVSTGGATAFSQRYAWSG